MKMVCKRFSPMHRNTLFGFAEISIPEFDMVLKDVAVHQKNGSRWAQPPAKPQLNRDGAVIRNEAGKIQYMPIVEFGSRASRDEFSQAVVRALLEFARAFEEEPV
jgi:hypothetical protein